MEATWSSADSRRREFDTWLHEDEEDPTGEDRINPQLFLLWQASLPRAEGAARAAPQMRAILTGTTGVCCRYAVMPVARGEGTAWLGPAGFEKLRRQLMSPAAEG